VTNKKNGQVTYAIVAILIVAIAYFSFTTLSNEPQVISQIVEVAYSDGSVERYSGNELSNIPLLIAESPTGRILVNLTTRLYVTAVYSGVFSSYSITGSTYGNLYDGVNGAFIYRMWSSSTPLTGSYLPSGSSVLVASSTVTASQLQSFYTGWQVLKRYRYTVESPYGLTLTITFTNGPPQARTVTPASANYYFNYRQF